MMCYDYSKQKIKSSVKNELNQTLEVELESICAIIATSIKSL